MISAVEATVAFMIVAGPLSVTEAGSTVMDITYLGSQGMFVSFVVVFVTVQIDHICAEKNIYIHMPDIVPQFLQDGFAGIVPMLFNTVIALAISSAVTYGTGGAYSVCSGFMALLSAPLGVLLSVPGMFVLGAFAGILWCFGIHGTMILIPAVIMGSSLIAVTRTPRSWLRAAPTPTSSSTRSCSSVASPSAAHRQHLRPRASEPALQVRADARRRGRRPHPRLVQHQRARHLRYAHHVQPGARHRLCAGHPRW